VFLWPAATTHGGERTATTQQGYHLLHWTSPQYEYWAVSDLGTAELGEFTRLLRQADSAATR